MSRKPVTFVFADLLWEEDRCIDVDYRAWTKFLRFRMNYSSRFDLWTLETDLGSIFFTKAKGIPHTLPSDEVMREVFSKALDAVEKHAVAVQKHVEELREQMEADIDPGDPEDGD